MPGMPPCGWGLTPEDAVAGLLISLLRSDSYSGTLLKVAKADSTVVFERVTLSPEVGSKQ